MREAQREMNAARHTLQLLGAIESGDPRGGVCTCCGELTLIQFADV